MELLCGTFHSCPTKGYAQSMYFFDKRATVVHVRAAPLVVREKTIGTEQGRTRVDGSGSIRDKSANDKRANT